MNTAASSFAESLGLKAAPRSPLAIANSIKAGLPLAALERLSKAIAPDDANFPYRFVPRATLTRRKRSEEHTSELQSLMRISYAVFCLKKKNNKQTTTTLKNEQQLKPKHDKAKQQQ